MVDDTEERECQVCAKKVQALKAMHGTAVVCSALCSEAMSGYWRKWLQTRDDNETE